MKDEVIIFFVSLLTSMLVTVLLGVLERKL